MSRVILQQVRQFLRVLPEASDMGKPFETQAHFSRMNDIGFQKIYKAFIILLRKMSVDIHKSR